jgi:hypothetical protein
MKSLILAVVGALALASAAHATDLKGVGQIGAIGGIGGAGTFSSSKVDAWKSFGLDGNGTVTARAAGVTVFEGSIDNRAGVGHNAIGTGQDVTSRLYTGSEAFSGATLTAPGAATANAGNVTGGAGVGIAGNGGLTIRN